MKEEFFSLAKHANFFKREKGLSPLSIALIYIGIGILWVFLSEQILALLVIDPANEQIVLLAKNFIFVILTGFLLYHLIRRSKEKQQRFQRRLQAVLESTPDAVFVVDAFLNLVDVNQAGSKILDIPSEQKPPLSFNALWEKLTLNDLEGNPVSLHDSPIHRALKGETILNQEISLDPSHNKSLCLSLSCAPIKNGTHFGAVCIGRDITEAKRLEQLRDDFVSDAAHEFKTPITTIKAYAQLMKAGKVDNTEAITAIERQSERLNRIVQGLIELSKLKGTLEEGTKEVLNLRELVEYSVRDIERATQRHSFEVTGEENVAVRVNRHRIEQVIRHILDNATRYQPKGGKVQIHVSTENQIAIISVRDYGVGIPTDRQGEIFNLYAHPHAETQYAYLSGMGIGLNLAWQFMRQQGGNIWFRSKEGQGTTFYLALPLEKGSELDLLKEQIQ
jgi:two-component system, OmpR family, phosphate regulon sensor histidine kinase PhoR